jgi:hypothetical protein
VIIVCIVLSSLALLAAVVNITLILVDKKREPMRRQALLDYIDNVADGTLEEAEEYAKQRFAKEYEARREENAAFAHEIDKRFERQQAEIQKLKAGAEPDYQQAMAAAKAVNDFNSSIISIMNFDPIEVARRNRNNGAQEDE